MQTDLNAPATPEEVPIALRNAARLMNEQCAELQSAWGDAQAGRIWQDFARILERAADSCERAITRRG